MNQPAFLLSLSDDYTMLDGGKSVVITTKQADAVFEHMPDAWLQIEYCDIAS